MGWSDPSIEYITVQELYNHTFVDAMRQQRHAHPGHADLCHQYMGRFRLLPGPDRRLLVCELQQFCCMGAFRSEIIGLVGATHWVAPTNPGSPLPIQFDSTMLSNRKAVIPPFGDDLVNWVNILHILINIVQDFPTSKSVPLLCVVMAVTLKPNKLPLK